MKLNGKKYSKAQILSRVGSLKQIAGSQRYMLEEGRGKGTSMIRIRNGSGLDFSIIPDKCMDIFDISFNGVQLAWISKNDIVANKFFDTRNLEWVRSFGGGMLVTCGLRNAGPPEEDGTESFGIHGRISGTPAQNVSIKEYWENDIFYQEISGKIVESNVFGENLVIYRTIYVNSEESVIELEDRIVNEGFDKQQLMLLYHLNWGFPLLSAETKLITDSKSIIQRGEDQSELKLWNKFSDPVHGYFEKVFFHDLNPDKNQQVSYQISNPGLGIGVRVSWDKSQLPFLTQWKMTGESDYVLGLEPGNCRPIGRKATRESGEAEYLDAFQEKRIVLRVSVNGAK